jgi:molybdopterin synthase catalytic subunit
MHADAHPHIDVALVPTPVQWHALPVAGHVAGGECVFLGRTRAETHPQFGTLRHLQYEAHESLAIAECRRLALHAATRYRCLAVRIHHALGVVPPGDASVLIQTSCAHRAEAFDACRQLIDSLKQSVPIWKRECWALGSSWSTGSAVNTAPQQHEPSP